MDRRMVKTRLEIKQAFIHLLKERSFDELTVKEIANEANINRATFYKHYEDKYDLIAHLEEAIITKVRVIIEESSPIDLTTNILNQPAYQTIVDMYRYIGSERELIEVLISPKGNQSFLTHMQFLLENMLRNHFVHIEPTKQRAAELELLVVYLASAHLGLMKHWLLKRLTYTPEEMAKMLMEILRDGPAAVLAGLTKET